MAAQNSIDFAYRYPFSEQAREIIRNMDFNKVNSEHLGSGVVRLQSALTTGTIKFNDIGYEKPKIDSIAAYVYSRMLVSAMKNSMFVNKYALAEAKRAIDSLRGDTEAHLLDIAGQSGLKPGIKNGIYSIDFVTFLQLAQQNEGNALVNQNILEGVVNLDRYQFLGVLESAIAKTVGRGLPIPQKSIPKEVIDAAKTIKVPVERTMFAAASKGGIRWIERLLVTPIPDCRHRTVNLILAPYMVNTRDMSVDEAVKRIVSYIDLCKTVNPNTNITERYIRYQCEWSKNKGMKPLSLERAKNELFSSMDIDLLGTAEEGKNA